MKRDQPKMRGSERRGGLGVGRKLALVACLLSIAGLCVYSAGVGPRRLDTIKEILARPRDAATVEISLVSNVRVRSVREDGVELEQGGAVITARMSDELRQRWSAERRAIKQRDYISLRGTYDPAGYLVLTDFHIHRGRTFKIWLSGVALLLAAGVMGYEWVRRRGTYA